MAQFRRQKNVTVEKNKKELQLSREFFIDWLMRQYENCKKALSEIIIFKQREPIFA